MAADLPSRLWPMLSQADGFGNVALDAGFKMDVTALSDAPLAVQCHIGFALPALVLGPIALLRHRRDLVHRLVGRAWVVAMLGLSISSFFVHSVGMIGPFSPLHILSVTTLIGLIVALRAAVRRDFIAHGRAMRALFLQALVGAGVFTFLPGRRLNALFDAANPQLVFWLAVLIGLIATGAIWFHPPLSRTLKTTHRIPLFKDGS